jgi:hypothetical protein
MATDRGPVGDHRRPALLAGGLVATAGVLDVLAYFGLRSADPYVDMTGGGMTVLHTTGWTRLHVLLGGLVVLTGLLIATGRVRAVLVGLGVVVVAAATDALFLPYDPIHATMALGLHVSAVVVLVRNRRLLVPAGRAGPGGPVTGPGRPAR